MKFELFFFLGFCLVWNSELRENSPFHKKIAENSAKKFRTIKNSNDSHWNQVNRWFSRKFTEFSETQTRVTLLQWICAFSPCSFVCVCLVSIFFFQLLFECWSKTKRWIIALAGWLERRKQKKKMWRKQKNRWLNGESYKSGCCHCNRTVHNGLATFNKRSKFLAIKCYDYTSIFGFSSNL